MSVATVEHSLIEIAKNISLDGCKLVGPTSGSFGCFAVSQFCHERSVLLVTAHLDDADECVAMLRDLDVTVELFPALESETSNELIASRYALLDRLASDSLPSVIVASIPAVMQLTPSPDEVRNVVRRLHPGDTCSMVDFQQWLVDAGYERRESIEDSLQFATRGGILDIATAAGEFARLDFFGDTIESINEVDPVSLGSDCSLDEVVVAASVQKEGTSTIVDHLPTTWCSVLDDVGEISTQAQSYFDRVVDSKELAHLDDVQSTMASSLSAVIGFVGPPGNGVDLTVPIKPLGMFSTVPAEALEELVRLAQDRDVILTCRTIGEVDRMKELAQPGQQLAEATSLHIQERFVHRGFLVGNSLAVVPSHEVFHRYEVRREVRMHRKTMRQVISQFGVDDLVVHRDHGIAQYLGLRQLKGQDDIEYLTLQFAGRRLLHVPATHAHLVQRYIGAFKGRPQLSTLGGSRWPGQKSKAKGAIADLASEMLRVQAVRETAPGIAFGPDTQWMREFESSFPWDETEDQIEAIASVKEDMESPRPMDRLVCGDVGFGKTEIAIRAAFKAVESGRQVAILVPTTVLAVQHERTFKKRLADYPFEVESLTRFQSTSEQKEILASVQQGEVDILIGTHRILSQDVHFSRLGLVVIDEEQRFGVEHKQRLLAIRSEADVLTLTATPIPRTLHMALLGIRDISALQTAPVDRRAVVTQIQSWSKEMVAGDIRRELAREGQIFYVHNRVYDIEDVATEIRDLVPEATVIVGHGQMPPRALESVMLQFVRGEADVLVCTTIIESGIDIPSANTMFIDDADRFGLSDLHQLRGRVGRYKHRAYCTLLLPRDRMINPTARKRLYAIEKFSMLGAGFQIALRDLEIRGAGNLLGAEQSGHIAAVGYEMYCQMLERAVKELRDGKKQLQHVAMIDLGISGRLSAAYIPSETRRLAMYQRLASCEDQPGIVQVVNDLQSGYGELPEAARRLVSYHELKIGASLIGVDSMTIDDGDVVIRTNQPEILRARFEGVHGTLRMVGTSTTSDYSTLYFRPSRSTGTSSLLSILHTQLVQLPV